MKRLLKAFTVVMAIFAVLMLASPGYTWTHYHGYRHYGGYHRGFIGGGWYPGYYAYGPYYSYYGPYSYYDPYPYAPAPGLTFHFRF